MARDLAPGERVHVQRPLAGWANGPARLAVLGVLLCGLVSSNLLMTLGIPYAVPYGSFAAKLHPGSYFILAGFLWLLLRRNPILSVLELGRRAPAPAGLAAVIAIMIAYSIAMYGLSGSAFIIDTLLIPTLLALILDCTHPFTRRRLFLFIVAILALNAVVGLAEAAFQARLIPYLRGDTVVVEDFFRSTALQGHPLANALRTLVILICALLFIGHGKAGLLIWLFLASLLAFGSRTGIVLAGVLLGIWAVVRLSTDLRVRGLQPRRHFLMIVVTVFGLATLIALALFTSVGERIFTLFYFDESAKARFIVLQVFGLLSASDLWLGMGPRKIDNVLFLLSRTSSVTDIENVWLLFVMQFGLLLTLLFAIGLAAFLWSLARGQSLEVRLAVIAFAVFILSNNSLASKSQDMVLFVASVMGASAWESTEARLRRAQMYMVSRSTAANRLSPLLRGAPI